MQKVKDFTQNEKKRFANHVADKEFLSRIYKNSKLNNRKTTQFQNEQKTWLDSSQKKKTKNMQMANKHKMFHVSL